MSNRGTNHNYMCMTMIKQLNEIMKNQTNPEIKEVFKIMINITSTHLFLIMTKNINFIEECILLDNHINGSVTITQAVYHTPLNTPNIYVDGINLFANTEISIYRMKILYVKCSYRKWDYTIHKHVASFLKTMKIEFEQVIEQVAYYNELIDSIKPNFYSEYTGHLKYSDTMIILETIL